MIEFDKLPQEIKDEYKKWLIKKFGATGEIYLRDKKTQQIFIEKYHPEYAPKAQSKTPADRRAARTGQPTNLPQFIVMADGTKIPVLTWRQANSDWEVTGIVTNDKGEESEEVVEEGGQVYVPIVSAQYLTQDVLDRIEQGYVFGIDSMGNIAKSGKALSTDTDLLDYDALDAIPRSSMYYTYLQPQGITPEEAGNDITRQWLDFYSNLKLTGQEESYFADESGMMSNRDDVIKKQLFSTTKQGQEQLKQTMEQERIRQESEGQIKLGEATATVEQGAANQAFQEDLKKRQEITPAGNGQRIIYAGETPEGGIRPGDIIVAQSEEEASRLGAESWIPAAEWFGQGRDKVAENEAGRVTTLYNQGGGTPIQAGMNAEQTGRWKALGSEGQVEVPTTTGTEMITGKGPISSPFQTTVGGQRAEAFQASAAQKITDQQQKWQELVAKAQEKQRLLSARPQPMVKF